MVEFGLKLEDNKVAEWADKYIDYERLKVLLRRAKSAAKNREALEKRKPELASEIISDYANAYLAKGRGTPLSLSAHSLTNLSDAASEDFTGASIATDKGSDGRASVSTVEVTGLDEKSSLLQKKDSKKFGSRDSLSGFGGGGGGGGDDKSDSGVGVTLYRAVSGVTGYFTRERYASKLREALREIDVNLVLFSQCLYQELDKVNNFYIQKADDIGKRLDVLLDNVYATSGYDSRVSTEHSAESKSDRSINKVHIRKASIAEKVQFALQSIVSKRYIKSQDSNGSGIPLKPKPDIKLLGEESDDEIDGDMSSKPNVNTQKNLRESDSIKRAIIDLYRTAKLLTNFSIMNYTGFVKIIKKHDKLFPERKGQFSGIVDQHVCHEGKEADQLAGRMEKYYADWFCDGDLREARAKMLPKRGDGLEMDWSQLRLGYRLGMCAILALWVCWDCIWGLVANGNTTIGGRTAFPVFRACGGLLLLHWFWGFSVYIWTRYRINYIFLFDFNPRIVDTPINIFNDAVDETLVFLVCMLLYYKSGANDIPNLIPPGGYPFILVLFAVKKLIFPWRTRGPLWTAIWDVVTAPLTSPSFFHTYIADVFTSMVKVFQDIMWTTCFIFSGDFLLSENSNDTIHHEWQHKFWYKNVVIPLVCLFPLWIRFNQCLRRYMDTGKRWPNLANAFKYAMSQTVTLFGAFHPLYMMHFHNAQFVDLFQFFWMGLFVASSLYSFTWDVYMDWGLGRPKFGFLGPRLMFPNRFHYYGVVCADLFLRFMWVLTLIPPQSGAKFELPNYLSAVTMSLELMRRTLWGFFRLEHEHRHNTSGYRRVDFVPLHFNTGHDHKYAKQREHVGWHVLAEVGAVSAAVVAISISSVIAAQRASRTDSGP